MGFPEAVRDYPGRLTVPTAVRAAGYIPFWWHPLTYSRHTNLGETGERGCVEEVLVSLDWRDFDAFLVYAHGFTEPTFDANPDGLGLARTLPLQSPFNPQNWLTDVTLVNRAGPYVDDPVTLVPVPDPGEGELWADPDYWLTGPLVGEDTGGEMVGGELVSGVAFGVAGPPDAPAGVDDPALSYRFGFEWVQVKLTFETRSYRLIPDYRVPYDDGTVPGEGDPPAPKIGELSRYVTRYPLPNARERKVPGGQLAISPDPASGTSGTSAAIAEPGFLIDRGGSLTLIWHQVPFDYIPWGAIGECSGRVNAYKFDPYSGASNPRGIEIPAERALFRGLAESPVPYKGWDGRTYVDLKYSFLIRLPGETTVVHAEPGVGSVPTNPTWNQYLMVLTDATLKMYKWVWKTSSSTPRAVYETADFDLLFRLEA